MLGVVSLTPQAQRVRPVAEGFEARLRYGAGKRGRFVLRAKDEAQALDWITKLTEAAALLTRSGRNEHAALILKRASEATSEKDFAARLKWIADFAAGKKPFDAPRPAGSLTFAKLAGRWTGGDLARDYPDHVRVKKSADDDEYRLEVLCKTIGDVPIASFKLDDAERAMRALPKHLAPASRRQYAQLVSRVLGLAVYPCRLITASPIPRGWLPKLGARKAFAFLYPAEDAELMASAVPLVYRLLYGFLAREGVRRSEAQALTFADLDLETGTVRLDENKTDDPRAWALGPDVVRALKVWRDTQRKGAQLGDRVFVDASGEPIDWEHLAARLREHLKMAGLSRQELFNSTTARQRLRAHDLRGTFVTLALASGKTETWVMDRTGHTTSMMLNKYRRAARSAAELGLGWLAPLDLVMPALEVGQRVGQRDRGGPNPKVEGAEKAPNLNEVHEEGVEPSRLAAPEPKLAKRRFRTSRTATFPDIFGDARRRLPPPCDPGCGAGCALGLSAASSGIASSSGASSPRPSSSTLRAARR
jgi:integrase